MTEITDQIRKAYRTYEAQYGRQVWMPITAIAYRTDLTRDQLRDGLTQLGNQDPSVDLMPESNQKTLTAEDRTYRVWLGGDWNDLLSIR